MNFYKVKSQMEIYYVQFISWDEFMRKILLEYSLLIIAFSLFIIVYLPFKNIIKKKVLRFLKIVHFHKDIITLVFTNYFFLLLYKL